MIVLLDTVARHTHACIDIDTCVYTPIHTYIIYVNKVDKQLTHAIHVKDSYSNGKFIDKLTKWHQ